MARIGQDLAKIRKIQGKTLEDVHRSSRIPVSVLSSIEDGSIFSSLSTNKTMIRSNVRSFARVLKLDDDAVIAALDRLTKGDDTHFLKEEIDAEAQQLLDNVHGPAAVQKKESKIPTKPSKKDLNEAAAETYSTTAKADEEDESSEPKQKINDYYIVEEPPVKLTEATNSVSNSEISSVDWERLNRKTKIKRPPTTISWLSVFAAVIILTLGSLYFVGYFDFLFDTAIPTKIITKESSTADIDPSSAINNENWLEELNDKAENTGGETPNTTAEEIPSQPIVPKPAITTLIEEPSANETTDASTALAETTLDNEAVEQEDSAPKADDYRFMTAEVSELPEELEVLVYAATDNLAPVRVQWDGLSSLRPYWVELGQAMRVGFKSELRIRTLNYSRMILVFNGHAVTNLEEQFYNQEAGLLIIPRSFFEADPASWIRLKNPSEDFDGISKPSKIIDRPTFN